MTNAADEFELDVAGLGTLVVDHQMFVNGHPRADSKAVATRQRLQVGGPVVTAFATLSALGAKAGFLGSWNSQSFGQLIEDDFAATEVRLNKFNDADATTGVAHVWIDQTNGDRTIVCARGTEISVGEQVWALIDSAKALHLDGWPTDACLAAAQRMRSHKRLVFLDAGSPKPGYDQLLSNVDVLFCPAATAQKYWDQDDAVSAGRRFLETGPSVVVVTQGANGLHLHSANQSIDLPAFSVDAVDTNGAGDVFAGAFIFKTLQMASCPDELPTVDWKSVAQFAAATAAIKCQRAGNRQLPDCKQVEDFLHSRRHGT